jgi:DeoR/GlpR family transcriptional regulator of sugar metabolism
MKKLRTLEIVEFLRERKHCSMAELMERFNVSPATIHRDIAELTSKKLIQKVHGGVAIVAEEASGTERLNSHFSARIDNNTDRKSIIAEKALDCIEDGDIIFLDSSTTAYHLAKKLQTQSFSSLTIITNSVLIIQEFHLFPPHFILISIGGNFNFQLNSFLGKTALENLGKLRIDKAFYSAVGITETGITTFHESHAEFLKQALDLACENYLLIDGSKFGKSGIFKIVELDKVGNIISDAKSPFSAE